MFAPEGQPVGALPSSTHLVRDMRTRGPYGTRFRGNSQLQLGFRQDGVKIHLRRTRLSHKDEQKESNRGMSVFSPPTFISCLILQMCSQAAPPLMKA